MIEVEKKQPIMTIVYQSSDAIVITNIRRTLSTSITHLKQPVGTHLVILLGRTRMTLARGLAMSVSLISYVGK